MERRQSKFRKTIRKKEASSGIKSPRFGKISESSQQNELSEARLAYESAKQPRHTEPTESQQEEEEEEEEEEDEEFKVLERAKTVKDAVAQRI